MWAVVVEVDVPDLEGVGSLLFRGPGARVKELLGKNAVVALDFSVVARCVWRDALMAGAVKYFGEVVCRLPGSWDHLIASGMGPPWRVIEDARRVRLGQADRVECVGGRTVLR